MVFKKVKSVMAVSGLFMLVGCSTIGDGVDAAGSGVLSAGQAYGKATSDVHVEAISTEQFKLVKTYDEPVRSLDSWAMRIESRQLCPEGYVYVNRFASKTAPFGMDDAQCLTDNCIYKLEWQIKCQKVAEEPFSFFGKT